MSERPVRRFFKLEFSQEQLLKNPYFKSNPDNFRRLVDLVNLKKTSYGSCLLKKSELRDLKQWIDESLPLLSEPYYTLATKCHWILTGRTSFPICPICKSSNGYQHKNVVSWRIGYHEFCSLKCMQKSEKVLKKKEDTCLQNYGVAYPSQCKETWDKRRKTLLEKTGYEDPLKDPKTKDQARRTRRLNTISRFLGQSNKEVQLVSPIEEYLHNPKNVLRWKCCRCGQEFNSALNWRWYHTDERKLLARCLNCYPLMHGDSEDERELADYIKEISKDHKVFWKDRSQANRKVIHPYEIDIWIPDLKLGIEFDGVFWHSVEFKDAYDTPVPLDRGLEKTRLCEELGIRLVHIYEDEWQDPEKQKKTKEFLKGLVLGNLKIPVSKMLILPRDKFSKAFRISGYELVEETPPKICERRSEKSKMSYHVYDCGNLVYKQL